MSSDTRDVGLSGEHRRFVSPIEALGSLAASVGTMTPETLRPVLDELHEFLAHQLLPHAVGEGLTVYPEVRRALGGAEKTVEMTHDHAEIARLTDELDELRTQVGTPSWSKRDRRALAGLLSELHRLISEHLEQEEEVCRAVLEGTLSGTDAEKVLERMRRAAAELRDLYE